MKRELLREMVLSMYQEEEYSSSCFSNNEKKFFEAFKKTGILTSKIQTLSFNFSDAPVYIMDKPTGKINADWLLIMGILHIYLECFLICETFYKDKHFTFDEERIDNIRTYRNRTLSHIENFKVDHKSGTELILDIKYMVHLISKYMCELINEEDPHPKSLSYRWEDKRLGLVYTNTVEADTTSHLDALQDQLNNQ